MILRRRLRVVLCVLLTAGSVQLSAQVSTQPASGSAVFPGAGELTGFAPRLALQTAGQGWQPRVKRSLGSSSLGFMFQSSTACNLSVTVRDLSGSVRGNARVERFNQAGFLDFRTTNDAGQAVWNQIPRGTYRLDAYFPSADPFDNSPAFWAQAGTTLSQAVHSLELRRNWPVVESVRVFRQSDGQDVTGEEVQVGTAVRIEVTVRNRTGSSKSTRAQMRLDRSRTAPWDWGRVWEYTAVSASHKFVAEFTPGQPGTYFGALLAEVAQVGKTDSRDWFVAFEAVSLDGRFEPSTYTLDFGAVEVGRQESRNLTVRNLGNTPIQVALELNQGSGFRLGSASPIPLNGHSTSEVTINFEPSKIGAHSQHLVLSSVADPNMRRWVQLAGAGTTPGQQPVADFTWEPPEPPAGAQVQFRLIPGREQRARWDFESDGIVDSESASPVHAFASPGPYPVSLQVENAYGKDSTTKTVNVSGGAGPAVHRVQRQYPGFFLAGATFTNLFTVGVNWKGAPGRLGFSINGAPPQWYQGESSGASHLFTMNQDFVPSFRPSRLVITPQNAAGVTGFAWTENVYVFPWPRWLELAAGGGGVRFLAGAGEIRTLIDLQFPRTPLAKGCDPARGKHVCPIKIPDWVPLLGGEFGLTETFAALDARLSSLGKGDFRLSGQTGFAAMGRYLQGEASGAGTLLLSPGNGLEVLDGSLRLRLYGTVANDVGIVELIPGLKSLAKKPIIKEFNKLVRLGSQVSPRLDFTARFAQDQGGDLAFTGAEGELGVKLVGSLHGSFFRILSASVWLAGDGTICIGLPEPVFRELALKLQAGARISINYFLGTWRKQATFNAGCRWSPNRGIRCGTGDGYVLTALDGPGLGELRLIEIDYDRFGPYSLSQPRVLARQESSATPVNAVQTSLVTNLFPGASPALTNVAGGSLLLWEHQDRGDAVLQSTEIAFSWNDGNGWSSHQVIHNDTRAELGPVAVEDGTGGAVAAWTRSSNPNFSEVPKELEELPPFFRQLEIVTSRFDPTSQTWTQPAPLTQNTAFETDLQLAFDGSGKAWLTWLENPAGELISTPEAPSSLRYSVWNGLSWSAPAQVAGNLVGVGSHALAASAAGVVILLAIDPDLELTGDERIALYTWQGPGWSSNGTFAGADGTENRLPSVAFDASGVAHVVWLRNGDLVHATLQHPAPTVVRAESGGLGFFGSRLLASPAGHLALVFQRETEEGPGDLYALVYDALTGGWSVDRRLTAQSAASAYDLSGYFDQAGILHLAFLNNYVEWVTETVSIEGEDWSISGIPEQGRTDLELLERSLIVDLAITQSDVTLLPADPEPGETAEVRVRVQNSGDFPVGGFQVGLYRSPGIPGPILLSSSTVAGLRAGGEKELTFSFTCPASALDLLIKVDPQNDIHEFSESNNSVWIPLTNLAPVADPVASVTAGLAPLTVEFDGSTSVDPDGQVIGFEWRIPEAAAPIAGAKISFTFTQPGTHPVGLTVTDDRGRRSTSYVTVTVQPSRRFFPFYQASGQSFTGFAVSNFSDRNAGLEWRLYDPSGNLVGGPRLLDLEPGAQLAQLGHELFAAPGGTPESGWVELRSDNPELGSFFLFGDGIGLDGAVESVRYSSQLNFSRVYEGSTAYRGRSASTFLSIANPGGEEALLDFVLYQRVPGGMAPTKRVSRSIPAGGFFYQSVKVLFAEQAPIYEGYVTADVRSGNGVVGFSLIKLDQGRTTLGLGGASSGSGTSRQFSAQLGSMPAVLYTNLRLINLSGEPRSLELTAIAEDGTVLAGPVARVLGAGDAIQSDVSELFQFGGSGLVVGSLRVDADGGGVLGDVVFGSPNLRYAAALPLQNQLAVKAVFSQVANIPGSFYTGLALHNPQGRTAGVRIEVFRADGSLAGGNEIELQPGWRISKTLTELVPASDGVIRGYVRIESTEPLVLQQMFGDFAQSLLAAVPPAIVK